MGNGFLLISQASINWLNVLESSFGSLVGALFGALLAYWIGTRHMKKQQVHDREQRNKDKKLDLKIKELEYKRDNIKIMIEEVYSSIEMMGKERNNMILSGEKGEPYIYNPLLFVNFSNLIEFTLKSVHPKSRKDIKKIERKVIDLEKVYFTATSLGGTNKLERNKAALDVERQLSEELQGLLKYLYIEVNNIDNNLIDIRNEIK